LRATRFEDAEDFGAIAFVIDRGDSGMAYCNGVLLARRFALTAAHCCVDGAKLYAIPAIPLGGDIPTMDEQAAQGSLVLSCEKRDTRSERLADDLAFVRLQKIVSGGHRGAQLVAPNYLVTGAPLVDLGDVEKGRIPVLEPAAGRVTLVQILPPGRLAGFSYAPLRRELVLAGFDSPAAWSP